MFTTAVATSIKQARKVRCLKTIIPKRGQDALPPLLSSTTLIDTIVLYFYPQILLKSPGFKISKQYNNTVSVFDWPALSLVSAEPTTGISRGPRACRGDATDLRNTSIGCERRAKDRSLYSS